MDKLFISHSSQDDGFVRELRKALELHGQAGWVDSRELRGGDPQWREIKKAIEDAMAFVVVVSPDALQSKWVGKELRHALNVQKKRSRDKYLVIPLSLDKTKLGVLEEFFGEEPVYIPVNSGAGGIDAVIHPILIALGKREPHDVAGAAQPKTEPLEELVLELTDLNFHEQDGVRRASARARLVYEPATPGQPQVHSIQTWRFIAPIGPIEVEELRWYLEKYAIWPSEYFRNRARKVEESLVKWGQLLYEAALPVSYTVNVLNAWARIDDNAGRRFSVYVDAALEAGAPAANLVVAHEATTVLLGLPWELIHDGGGYLFQGAKPTRVRRRLPNTRMLDVPIVATPIRILLVTARPEDDACDYLDHRVSALPLVEAMEGLGGLVHIHVLNPPTLPALEVELARACGVNEPYHIVHFDGHGVYDRNVGLGGLCFEDPEDTSKLEKRRHITVFTNELGPLLRDHRIPLVFLEACQTAKAEKSSESVASELLKAGVASVVAMSHSVLVETARRFVNAFYAALARGSRIGDAMLEGQRTLKTDTSRGRIFGVDELRLEDWFVPVLFQEKDDPQLFHSTPARQTQEDVKIALKKRLGELPAEPETGFIGRSRELLALQRLLHRERFAVVRGQAGEGKTALAAEFARWMVRSQQIRRAVFISVETHSHAAAVLDAIGRQLMPDYSAAMFDDFEKAILPIERSLAEQSTLLVIDNMESILLPPYIEMPEVLSEDAHRELGEILRVCTRFNAKGDTRLVFTSREALPAPFDVDMNRLELGRLATEDALKFVERALAREAAGSGDAADAERDAIEQLVEAVHGHARTLSLLIPSLRECGVDATHASLLELMADMEKKYPGNREKSVFASVELSLRRMSPANRDKARVLGVFYGTVDLNVLCMMMEWAETDVTAMALELIEIGLASPNNYSQLTLNPALCPYLRGRMDAVDSKALTIRWRVAMQVYVNFLSQQQFQDTEISMTLTVSELPNLLMLLEQVRCEGNAAVTIDLATSLMFLLQGIGKPHLLEYVTRVRDSTADALGEMWNHARFIVIYSAINQQLADGRFHEALEGAQQLLQRARAEGVNVYPSSDYDLGMACFALSRALKNFGRSEEALILLNEMQERFESIAHNSDSKGAALMLANCFAERADNLRFLGRLDEAASAYEENIRRVNDLGNIRGIAVGKAQLGKIYRLRGHYKEAFEAYREAYERFSRLEEPHGVAGSLHEMGMIYQETNQPEAAEDAYRKALAIFLRIGHLVGQASTLSQLGNLYDHVLGHPEEAVVYFQQALKRFIEIGDMVNEGGIRSNLGDVLRKLNRFDEARQEIRRAVECKSQFGHRAEIWKSWGILADIEANSGNPTAAVEAKQKALDYYLSYRRDGGENYTSPGQLASNITMMLLHDGVAAAASFMQGFTPPSDATSADLKFIDTLKSIIDGSRDCTLANDPDFHYMLSAEIILLLETLERHNLK